MSGLDRGTGVVGEVGSVEPVAGAEHDGVAAVRESNREHRAVHRTVGSIGPPSRRRLNAI